MHPFRNFLAVLPPHPPPPPPYTKLKHGKNSRYTRPTLFEGWGEGLDLFELENTPEMLPWVPEVFLTCGGNFRCWPKAEATRVTIKTWQKPKTALEKSLAPRVQKCESVPRLLSMIVVYLYNFSTPYWYPPQINIISSKKQLECFLKGGANSSIYAITHKIQRLLAYLPALSCASTLAPFCSSNSTIRAIPSDEVIVRELLGSEVADADQGLCTAQDYQCNYSS